MKTILWLCAIAALLGALWLAWHTALRADHMPSLRALSQFLAPPDFYARNRLIKLHDSRNGTYSAKFIFSPNYAGGYQLNALFPKQNYGELIEVDSRLMCHEHSTKRLVEFVSSKARVEHDRYLGRSLNFYSFDTKDSFKVGQDYSCVINIIIDPTIVIDTIYVKKLNDN